jgi:hypothetical protein
MNKTSNKRRNKKSVMIEATKSGVFDDTPENKNVDEAHLNDIMSQFQHARPQSPPQTFSHFESSDLFSKDHEQLYDNDDEKEEEQVSTEETTKISNKVEQMQISSPAITNNIPTNYEEDNMKHQAELNLAKQSQARAKELFSSSCVASQKATIFTDENIEFMKLYRHLSFSQIVADVDLEIETKQTLFTLFLVLGWIPESDIISTIFDCAINNEYQLAQTLLQFCYSQGQLSKQGWKLLRKFLGNFDRFQDRKQLKELCILLMQLDPTSMPTLNKWAKEIGKQLGTVCKGYCDLLNGNSKQFAMLYSKEL